MKAMWLLVTSNIRKGKWEAISFFIMILISAMLMNLGLITWLNYDKNFDIRAEQLNSADVLMTMQNKNINYIDDLNDELLSDTRTSKLEKRDCLFLQGKYIYGGSEARRIFAVLNSKDNFDIGRVEYMEKSEEKLENPIYLPYLFKTGGSYNIGDPFTLTAYKINGEEKSLNYKIAGFFDESMLGTINSSTTGLILNNDEYIKLSEEFLGDIDGTMFLVKLNDKSDGEVFSTEYSTNVPKNIGLFDSNFYDMLKQSRTVTSSIGAMIIVAFSIMIVVISLIVVRFRIKNSIEEDMKNIGALEAIGYTGKQIANSILMQFSLIGFVGIILGILATYIVLPFVSNMFAAQTGIVWKQNFDVIATLITSITLILSVAVVSSISTIKVRKLPPIVALRSGILTHSFKGNPLPLNKAKGGLITILAGKSFCQNIKRNILVGLIIAFISFAAVFAGVLYYNTTLKFDNFLNSIVGEIFDLQIDASDSMFTEELINDLEAMTEVRKAIEFSTDPTVQTEEGLQIMCYVTEDCSDYDNQNIAYKGRYPKYSNEVAIGGLIAKKLGKDIGDRITLIKGEHEMEYIITGLIQGSNYLGRDASLTEEGYHKISPDYEAISISVYMNDYENAEKFIEEFKNMEGSKVAAITKNKETIYASMGNYQGIVEILVIIVAVVTGAIIALTIYLVIQTSLISKKRDLGIQKAIGYTTWQLVMQTALSFLPVLILGTMVGCLAGSNTINSVFSVMFSGIGLMKVNFDIVFSIILGIGIVIVSFGFLISVLVAYQIKKITPYELMSE